MLFRSVKMALVSVLPNILPLLCCLAWYGVSGNYLDLFPAILFPT